MRFLSIVLILSLVAVSGSAKILVSTLAQVKNHVITTREKSIHGYLEKALGDDFLKFSAVDGDEQMIREWLLFFEASTFYSQPLSDSLLKKETSRFRSFVQGQNQWTSLAVSGNELRTKVRRYFEARRLYEFKKKASILPVSAAEIETEYSQNRIRYGQKTFAEVKEQIRNSKIQENLNRRMEQWFLVLEKKYKVQRFSKFQPKK